VFIAELDRMGRTGGCCRGLLWVLFPLGTVVVDLDETQLGTLAYLTTAAPYWLMAIVSLLLLIVGLVASPAHYNP
jgi:hypothetical protein